ncbi:MAG: putative CAMK family protein kinase [Streblomastix strix]|uniref:Putative CAMK family protein kinase n=1 Tax=Streblomastix strix TaxID=222440 RepID=A0A5J4UR94_9EUKA|nr:MAG: putative CAMK family protein kinase [Streblomastix strix]
MSEVYLLESQGFQVFRTLGHGAFGQGDPVPFVVQFQLARQFDKLVVILLDFANMKTLKDIIKANYDLSPGTLRAIARQLFEGLRLIHEKGLVHRDIKGENLMMHCPPGSDRVILKIADFGLVKTPITMAPELVIGDRNANEKVDIWSMGVVLFQLAGHEYPIKATSVPELQKMMKEQQIVRPAAIKDDLLWNLLQKIFTINKKDRPTTEQVLQDPYFTGEQALKEVSAEAKQITFASLTAQQNGDESINKYDINELYTVPKSEIKKAINFDPDDELQQSTTFYSIRD